MAVGDLLGLMDRREHLLTRFLQVVLVGLAAFGVLVGRPSAAVNGAGALVVAFLPALLRREAGLRMDFGLVLWLTVAAVLHTIGILGPYRTMF